MSRITESLYRVSDLKINESLLNESKEGLTDYFYSLVNSLGMDYKQQVDNLLYYIDESDLLNLIDDIKE